MDIAKIERWNHCKTRLDIEFLPPDDVEPPLPVSPISKPPAQVRDFFSSDSSTFVAKQRDVSNKKEVDFFGYPNGIPDLPKGLSSSDGEQIQPRSRPQQPDDGDWQVDGQFYYPIRENFNAVVGIWVGDVTNIHSDAIVVPVTSKLQSTGSTYDRVIDQGGHELIQRFSQITWCNTGDAGIVEATDQMNCQYVVFANAPKFMKKRKQEALSVMLECYLRICELSAKNECENMVLPIVQPRGKQFPDKMASSLIAKSVRQFLTQHPNELKSIVICVENEKQYILMCHAFAWVFPRSEEEQNKGRRAFEQFHEAAYEEHMKRPAPSVASVGPGPAVMSLPDAQQHARSERLVPTGFGNRYRDRWGIQTEYGQTHRTWKANSQWAGADTRLPPHEIPFKNAYTRQLNRALRHQLTDMESFQFLYKSGKDHLNRSVVIWVASRFPASVFERSGQMNRVVMYIIRKLHTLVEKDYVILYFHTGADDDNYPQISWMTNFFRLLNHRYSRCLRAFYIVHPTIALKTTLWFLSNTSFWEKVAFINRLEELIIDHKFDPKMISIPGRVWEYDRDKFGSHWMGLPPPRLHPRIVYEHENDPRVEQSNSEIVLQTLRDVGNSLNIFAARAKELMFSNR